MKIVAVTACPSGVAHTYMAAEALQNTAKERGHEIKVETQGSIGIENALTKEEIKQADVVILTTDMTIKGQERFDGKKIVKVHIGDLVGKTKAIVSKIEKALSR